MLFDFDFFSFSWEKIFRGNHCPVFNFDECDVDSEIWHGLLSVLIYFYVLFSQNMLLSIHTTVVCVFEVMRKHRIIVQKYICLMGLFSF